MTTPAPSTPTSGIAWLVGRELLQAGLDRPSGEGDVRRLAGAAASDVLFLHLRAPSGEALFELSRAVVAGFLRQTEAMVPSGSESELLQLDDELHVLLSNGGADPRGADLRERVRTRPRDREGDPPRWTPEAVR